MTQLKSALFDLIMFTLLFAVLASPRAHAYVDPSTGSYILEMIAGFVLTSFFAIKSFLKNRVGALKKKSN